jgi:hypothetical protein
MAAWARNDFTAASKHLEEQLKAVERGQTSASGTQPDRRTLRHLIGVCASLNGDFTKAKRFFESVFTGMHINRQSLDDGDISAARWLGDVCLHMQEHINAALAYSVAYEGYVGRHGQSRDRTQRVADEIRLLDHWHWVFMRIDISLSRNVDPTSIFPSIDVVLKSNMMAAVQDRLYPGHKYAPPVQPTLSIARRPKCDFQISEGFLLGPLISLNTWPLPWDPTFSIMDAVQLDRYMDTAQAFNFPSSILRPLVQRYIPNNTLGSSKKLHYLTKRGLQWLIDTVKIGLRDIGIEHAEHPFEMAIVCRFRESCDGISFSEGLEINFSKLPFRNVYGIKITNVRWATRRFGGRVQESVGFLRDTSDFRSIVRSMLENAEADVDLPKSKQQGRPKSTHSGRQQSTKAATATQELDSTATQELDSTATQELDSIILPAELYSPPTTTQAAIDSVFGRPDIHEIGTSNESGVQCRN